MNGQMGSKRSRHCVSPPPNVALEDNNQHKTDEACNLPAAVEPNPPSKVVWQQWTRNFRATRRLKNDLISDECVDSAVERHMSLTKKRSLLDDSDSDKDDNDEGKCCYQWDAMTRGRHPLEFTPSGFGGPLGGLQYVTPVSSDPEALPICTLRRYGDHEEDEGEDQIPPPPPSFLRYPSKKRAVGVARPEAERDLRSQKNTACPAPPMLRRGVSSVEGLKLKGGDVVPLTLMSASLPPTWPAPSIP
jgi:hypothetical protein